ncbi:MAG: EamA family transporter [Pyrinomonadaceae bacterium]|nr:EamA family transporter [Pyrinomonadaceae bacterium]
MKIIVWIILGLIWGTTWLFIKVGLDEIPPFTFAMIRFIVAIAIVGFILSLSRIELPRKGSEIRLLAITGVLQFSVNYSLVFWSELHITSGLAAVLQATIPVFGLALAAVYLPEEKITKLKITALVLGVAGVAVIFYEQLTIQSLMAFGGSVAIVVGAFAAAHASILTKARGGSMHPAVLLFGQMFFGVGPVVIIALVYEGNPLGLSLSWVGVSSILYLSVFGTVVSFWLYYWLLSRIESTKAMTIALVTPFVAVVCGNVFLGEEFRLQTLAGGFLILASVGLIVFRRRLVNTAVFETATEKSE